MKLLRFLAIVLVIVAAAALPAQAQSGQTSISIALPEIVILHYFQHIDVSLTEAAILGQIGLTNSVNQGLSAPAAGTFLQSLAMSPTAPTAGSLTAATLTLTNAWAVRAILTGTRNVHVGIAMAVLADRTLTNAAGGTIVVSDTASVSPDVFAPPGLNSTQPGSIVLSLDLTGATRAGTYAHTGNATFTVTAAGGI